MSSDELPLGFRVIDTEYMRIGEPSGPIKYVALSYVWASATDESGKIQLERDNVAKLERAGSLADVPLPAVISDAIALCKDLGERYLWIDRFCIIQDDTVSKPAQIAAMDRIYQYATFTIIAALNNRRGAGLPGYTGRPRMHCASWFRPPLQPRTGGHGSIANGIEAIVNTSLWNRRGWTFQERIFSKRCLFITEYQAIFECAHFVAEEEFLWSANRPPGSVSYRENTSLARSLPRSTSYGPYNIPGLVTRGPGTINSKTAANSEYSPSATADLKHYCYWVENYTSRQLSHSGDIINAFSGVANVLRDDFNSHIIFGIPEKYMARSLMWSCCGVLPRRSETPQIPSWSWASWLGAVDYRWLSSVGRIRDVALLDGEDLYDTVSIVTFYLQDSEKGLRKLQTEDRWLRHVASIEDIACSTTFPPETMHNTKEQEGHMTLPAAQVTKEIWGECPHNPWETVYHSALDPDALKFAASFPDALVFNTTVASLSVQVLVGNKKRVSPDVEDAALCNHNGEIVGQLNKMGREWIRAQGDAEGNDKYFDCIVISGSLIPNRDRRFHKLLKKDRKMWKLDVMLVERLPLKKHVVRRVDVGQVLTYKWKKCCPRWETIVLC